MRTRSLLGAVCLCLGLTYSAAAAAQGTSPPMEDAPQISEEARTHYKNGMKAAGLKKWAEAHAAFMEAWKLNEHYQIAANLGSMEVKLGKFRDAAEHLAIYLRKAPADKVKDKMRAQSFFDEARKKVGAVQVTVNVNGAEILVDDKVAALSPLLDDLFVEPGPRMLKVRMPGYKTAEIPIEASPGSAQAVPVTLAKEPDAAPPILAPEPPPPPPPPPQPKEVPFQPSRPLVIAGIGVAVVGVLGGAIFAGVANSNASDAEALSGPLSQKSQAAYGTPWACSTGAYPVDCQHLRDSWESADSLGNASVWSFVIGGLAGAGTAVYALVLPKVLKTTVVPSSDAAPRTRASIAPVVAPGAGGLSVSGSF